MSNAARALPQHSANVYRCDASARHATHGSLSYTDFGFLIRSACPDGASQHRALHDVVLSKERVRLEAVHCADRPLY